VLHPDTLPPKISAYEPGTFAHFTITRRLPRIAAEAMAECEPSRESEAQWLALTAAIANGAEIDPDLLEPSTPFWGDVRARAHGARWSDLPFFDLEFCFYHALNTLASRTGRSPDVFARIRASALRSGLPDLEKTGDAGSVENALRLAIRGNESDLSQLHAAGARAASDDLVVDQTAALLAAIASSRGEILHLLADNAGPELCRDLLLADALLSAGIGAIVLHVKPWPMFVSDALPSDVTAAIEAFSRSRSSGKLAAVGRRLSSALSHGSFFIRSHPNWGEPRHMNQLDDDLAASLADSALVLVKGDLGYRRFFEDRSWPPNTAVARASVSRGTRCYALRVLKSEAVVGVDAGTADRLSRTDPEWRSGGRYALVQRVDSGG
jgi:damage control phosphatase ARMT1-like protein